MVASHAVRSARTEPGLQAGSPQFPHTRELLADGVGLVVPHGDAQAMARAVRRVLTEPGLAEAMTARCARLAPALSWTAVANRYRALATSLLAARA